jgi:three-Cys-motif partner protein
MDSAPLTDDGLTIRNAGSWAKDKLEIIRDYLYHFGIACKNKAPTFYFVDAFSGPGINRIEDTGELVWGSPLLAIRSAPPFAKCLFMDLNKKNIESLEARTEPHQERVVVRRADCNRHLVSTMAETLNRHNPCLCLLDPEGSELEWETVAAISRFKRGRYKAEQLILLPTHTGFIRQLFVNRPLEEWAENNLTRMYGSDEWRDIYERRVAGRITTDEATTEYVRLYAGRLRGLGYENVLDREIRDHGFGGPLRYFLLFATDNQAGYRIMDHIFNTVAQTKEDVIQLPLFSLPRRKRAE